MAADKGRITIDLTPELRRQVKAAAAQVDKSMRDFVTESLQRDLALVQQTIVASVAVNAPQLLAIQQLTEPVRAQLAAIAAQAASAVQASQQEVIDETTRTLREQLAVLATDAQVAAAVPRVIEQQRAVLNEALGRVQRTYLAELIRAQQAQLALMQQQLDPFARDWASDEDSIYDDVE
jgi:hypothetical protein